MIAFRKIAGPLVAVAAMVTGATVALADGMASKGRAAAVAPTSWSGFYFGVGSGFQWSNSSADSVFLVTGNDFDHSSAFVTFFGGVQHQFGSIVLGVEGGWKSTFRDDWGREQCIGVGIDCQARLNDILTIGGRLGWAAGHWMPYLTGGYATARFEQEVRVQPLGILLVSSSTRHDRWYLGGGFEWQVSPGWTAGLEYRHYEFGDDTGPLHTPGGLFVADLRSDASVDTIAARVAWRWDVPGRSAARPLK
jgi:outer membrane immunogenic protein